MHLCINTKSAILICAAILKHFHASYFNELLQILHHRLHIQSVSSSDLEDEKISKAFTSIIPGGSGGPIYTKLGKHVQGVALNTYASVLCHIHSATHWTQEVTNVPFA